MKIAVNTRFLLQNKIEGLGRVTLEVLKRMVVQHPEDEFLFLFDRPFHDDFVFAKNVKPLVVNPPARHPFLWYLWFELGVPAVLKKYKADVFLSPDSYLSLRTSVPTLMILHDIAYKAYPNQIPFLVRKYYQYFTPKFLKKADHIVTVSHFVKQDILHQFPSLDPTKISVAHNACTPGFEPVDAKTQQSIKEKYAEGKDFFFYIGSMHPRKNIARLITAFDIFKKKTNASIKLLLGGRLAWQTGEIKAALENAAHKADIHLIGFVKTEELPKIVGSAKALTYVSLFEGFGLPILEAMQCDVPVLTSNTSSMPEVAGDAAILVDPTSEASIAQGLQDILDPTIQKKLIEKGKVQRTKFNWDQTAEHVYQKLKQLSK